MAALGVLAGIAVAYARMPLHLPGHKVMSWMPVLLAGRLLTGARAGAATGTLLTILTTLALGGRLAGGVLLLPMVILAGVLLDCAAVFIERRKVPPWRALFFLALAGAAGNLACFVKRLAGPDGAIFSNAGAHALIAAAGSYALFGFLAGLSGAAVGLAGLALRAPNPARQGE
ncbi:MAG TPA: hypothetical protein VFC78_19150 [Tepidisphaeraceae bacterium]|nr:hypothetical protein [Tepidisphaeraceae bacterium]